MKTLYGTKDQQILNTDIKDYIWSNLEHEDLDKIEFPIEVLAYNPKEIRLDGKCILEDLLTRLDEDYAQEDYANEPTKNMSLVADMLANIIKVEYTSYYEPNGDKYLLSKEEVLEEFGLLEEKYLEEKCSERKCKNCQFGTDEDGDVFSCSESAELFGYHDIFLPNDFGCNNFKGK